MSKRVLFIGKTDGPSTSLYYYTNFVRLGFTVYPYDPPYFTSRTPLDQLRLRLRGVPTPQTINFIHRELVQLCARNSFDLIFVFSQNYLAAETLNEMRAVSRTRPLILYHSHDNNFAPGIRTPTDFAEALKAYDFVFTTKSQNEARYKRLGQPNALYIPSAFEPEVHRPIPAQESKISETFPVTFVGTFDQSRLPFFDAVGWDNLRVWGDRWSRYSQYARYEKNIFPRAVYYFEYSDILSHSQCVLGLLREEAEDRHTQRTFEIPACGALQLAPRNEEIQEFFTEGKEIALFDSPAELKEKTSYYLNHPLQARKIAKKGYERCLKGGHTYRDRVVTILEKTLGLAKKRRAG